MNLSSNIPARYQRLDKTEETDEAVGDQSDLRTPSQHDRDRILHAEAFRRLAGVTQVIDPNEGHVFHNRLTHSLKVAQIARRLAEKIIKQHPESVNVLGLDAEVAEAAALAHDLGHPPFGHIAERELDRLVRRTGLSDGYEGNPQAFRILARLEQRHTEIAGLNLTRATLNAVLKYPRMRQHTGDGYTKWGAYETERDIFQWVREGSPEGLRSIEAELMDWADDIAFSVHDVEDFYRAGLIPLDNLLYSESSEELDELITSVIARWKADKPARNNEIPDKEQLRKVFKGFQYFVPFSHPFHNTYHDYAILRTATATLIDRYIGGIRLNPDVLNNPSASTILIDNDLRTEIRLLKGLTWQFVIHNRAVATQQYGKQRVIRELFSFFMRALNAQEDKEAKFILPQDYELRLAFILDTLPELDEAKRQKQAKARLAADMISGMTDNEALAIHRRLIGIVPGSALDKIQH